MRVSVCVVLPSGKANDQIYSRLRYCIDTSVAAPCASWSPAAAVRFLTACHSTHILCSYSCIVCYFFDVSVAN